MGAISLPAACRPPAAHSVGRSAPLGLQTLRSSRGSQNISFEEALGGAEAIPDSTVYCLQVALQFPDQMLGDAGAVAARLEETTGSKMFILGDTVYGRCDLQLKWARPGDPGPMGFPLTVSAFTGRVSQRTMMIFLLILAPLSDSVFFSSYHFLHWPYFSLMTATHLQMGTSLTDGIFPAAAV